MKQWGGLLLILIFLIFPKKVWALSPVLEQWHVQENSQFDDTTIPCLERDGPSQWEERENGLGISIDQSLPCHTVITPKDPSYRGLRKFSLEFTMQIDENAHDHNILVLWKDRNNYIDFHLYGKNIEYSKILEGKPVFSSVYAAGNWFQKNHHYKVEHDASLGITQLWQDGRNIFTVTEPTDIPSIEDAWIGLRASVGEARSSDVTFKNFTATNTGITTTLTTPHILQNDPNWGKQTYDHAHTWSPGNPTLSRWGCALTSAVMVLHNYNIKHFTDGTTLNPGTLNSWLLSQQDGYFGEGHLNWRAITRLVAQLAPHYGTTKLEFSYVSPTNKLEWLRETLHKNMPVVLDMGGHFVTAYSAGPGDNDFRIHDPLFPITTLKKYHSTFLSARLFTPSQTDLSAVTIIAPNDISLTFTTESGSEVAVTRVPLPPLSDPLNNSKRTATLQLYDIAKPPDENIVITARSTQPDQSIIEMYTYTIDGESKTSKISVPFTSPEGSSLLLSGNNTDTRQVIPQYVLSQEVTADISHPVVASFLSRWKTELLGLSGLPQLELWRKNIEWILETAYRNEWLGTLEYQSVKHILDEMIIDRFP